MNNIIFKLAAGIFALIAMTTTYAQETANVNSQHSLLVNLGFSEGGMALGADYENGANRTFGWGGYLRLYPDNDDRDLGNAAQINAFGAFIRPHFTRQAWDLYVSPGFGIVQYERGSVDETSFGPILMLGLLYQFSGQMAFGVEQTSIYAWMNEDIRGKVSDELLGKFRFSF